VIQLSRKQTLGLPILCGAVILHATMWPYNFRFDLGAIPARLLSATRLPFSNGGLAEKKDIVLNVILFLPFGALLFLHRAKGIAASRSVLVPAFLGMLFSVVIETTQCLLPTRTPSLVDVCTNTLGALLGAIAARTSLRVVEQTTEEEARRAFRRNALFLSLAAYTLVLVVSNVYTLDPVRSMPELAVRGKAFLRSSWIEDATVAKASGR
jgi:VanZ family protein